MSHVIITENPTREQTVIGSTPTGSTSIGYEFFESDGSDIEVWVDAVLQVDPTDYSIQPTLGTEGGFAGGTVEWVVDKSNVTITTSLNISFSRSTDFPIAGAFNITTLNTQLDKLWSSFKQLDDRILRNSGILPTDILTDPADLDWPVLADRAGFLAGWDSNGALAPVANPDTNDNLTTIALLDVTDGNFIVGNGTTWIAESGLTARTSLGAAALAANTFTAAQLIQIAAVATAGTDADDLVIENTAPGGITVLSANTAAGKFAFGDPQDVDIGNILYDHSDNSMRFTVNAAEAMRIDNAGHLGIGIAAPDGTLHVHSGSAGSITAFVGADDVVVESDGDTGITLLSPSNKKQYFIFADNTSNVRTFWEYDHNVDEMKYTHGGQAMYLIDSSGNWKIGAITAPAEKIDVAGNVKATEFIGGGAGITGLATGTRNLVVNGEMKVAQRGTSFAALVASQYTLDQWKWIDAGATSAVVTITQDDDVPAAAEAGVEFTNSIKIDVTTSETLGTDEQLLLQHKIEASNCVRFGHNSAGAKTASLSFWMKSTKTGIFTVVVHQADAVRQYSREFTISTTNTWQFFSTTIPGDTSGTSMPSDNGQGMNIEFIMAAGTDNDTATADAWEAASANKQATSNQVNLVDNAANNILITGVQFELAPTASPYEHEVFADTLAKCQRFYWKSFAYGTAPVEGGGLGPASHPFSYTMAVTQSVVANVVFPVAMRAAPTVTLWNPRSGGVSGEWTNNTGESANARALWPNEFGVIVDNTGVGLAAAIWYIAVTAEAEL